MVAGAQMDIFSYLEDLNYQEPPVLLKSGQTVYLLFRGDVVKYEVYDEHSWLVGKHNRGYRLIEPGKCYWTCLNSDQGRLWFYDKQEAEAKANEFIEEHKENIICASDMNIRKTYAFEREYNGRKLQSFISVLDNGYMYVNEGSLYEHLEAYSEKRIDEFVADMQSKNAYAIDMIPQFKHMYRCKHGTWKYATAKYNYLGI